WKVPYWVLQVRPSFLAMASRRSTSRPTSLPEASTPSCGSPARPVGWVVPSSKVPRAATAAGSSALSAGSAWTPDTTSCVGSEPDVLPSAATGAPATGFGDEAEPHAAVDTAVTSRVVAATKAARGDRRPRRPGVFTEVVPSGWVWRGVLKHGGQKGPCTVVSGPVQDIGGSAGFDDPAAVQED